MFLEERQESIMNLLNTEGKVRVKELSAKFNVTDDCIRKDLGSLEKQGRLKRTYGGAVAIRENIHAIEVSKHKGSDVDAKRRIAQAAVTRARYGFFGYFHQQSGHCGALDKGPAGAYHCYQYD